MHIMEHSIQSPPLSPLHIRKSSQADFSPAHSYRTQHQRRKSSISSNHDRSPATPRSRHRWSNASTYSGATVDEPRSAGARDGVGNLADELDQLDDEDEYDDDFSQADANAATQEAIRDSGIDVSYADQQEKLDASHLGPHPVRPPDEDKSWTAVENVIDDATRVFQQSQALVHSGLPEYRQLLNKLEDLTAQEVAIQRLVTSTNSMAAHVSKETRSLQTLSLSLFSPFGLQVAFDSESLEGDLLLVDALLQALPQPDPESWQQLQKVARDTDTVVQSNLTLLDTAQMYTKPLNLATIHLRNVEEAVVNLLREHEDADLARLELGKQNSTSKLNARTQCQEIISGFDDFCNDIRKNWTEAIEAAA